jgi:Flp pilus assembly protein CpaB
LRRTSRLVLLLGIFLAAITFIVILALGGIGGGNQPTVTTPPTSADTVIAVTEIPLGTVVTSEMVTTQNLSLTSRNAGALSAPSQVIGSTARKTITAGAQVLRSDFELQAGQIDVTPPQGKRAFAISVNELTGVGNLVQGGDTVDILISLSGGAFPVVNVLDDGTIVIVTGLNPLSVKMPLLLEEIPVLGTISSAAAATTPAGGAAAPAPSAPAAPNVLTGGGKLLILAVTPAQAEVLLFARTTGILDVVIRSPLDVGVTETTDGVILKTLIDKYGVLPPQLVQTVLPD